MTIELIDESSRKGNETVIVILTSIVHTW